MSQSCLRLHALPTSTSLPSCSCCDSLGCPISVLPSYGTSVILVTWASVWCRQESGAVKDFVSNLQKLGSLSKFLCCEHAKEWNTVQQNWRKQWCTAVLLPGTGKTFVGNTFCLLMSPQQKALEFSQLPVSSHTFKFLLAFFISSSVFLVCVCLKHLSSFIQLLSSLYRCLCSPQEFFNLPSRLPLHAMGKAFCTLAFLYVQSKERETFPSGIIYHDRLVRGWAVVSDFKNTCI